MILPESSPGSISSCTLGHIPQHLDALWSPQLKPTPVEQLGKNPMRLMTAFCLGPVGDGVGMGGWAASLAKDKPEGNVL